MGTGELGQILQALGQVQGELKNVVSNQSIMSENIRADVKSLHARIDGIKTDLNQQITELYRKGCAHAGTHEDHEERLTVVEDWKITHDTESKMIAQDAGAGAGAKSGGFFGAGISAVIIALMEWLRYKSGN